MMVQSQRQIDREIDYRRGYYQALNDQQTYVARRKESPSYSWFIQAEANPKRNDQPDDAWLLEISMYQQQWEKEHYK